jgi:hypothetical protein
LAEVNKMATAAQAQPTPTTTDPVQRWLDRRAATNRANSQHSTGPRTEPGKQRSSQNALRHGLTARTAVLPTEDPEAYQRHIQQFLDEYQPATATETQLVHELANTSWRLNRIPFLEAELLSRATNPPTDQAAIETFDIVDAHRALATLGLHGSRLSRQFQKALEQLRDIQEERRRLERRHLNEAAEIFMRHQCKGLPWQPEEDGFVFSKEQVERHARHLMRILPVHYAPFISQWDQNSPREPQFKKRRRRAFADGDHHAWQPCRNRGPATSSLYSDLNAS